MHFYLNQIDPEKDEVHLVYWLRDHTPDAELPKGVEGHAFDYPMADNLPLKKKIPGIMKYGRFAKKVIREEKPDFLIVLHSTTGISIYNLLNGKYKGRYIFDYRDVTYEKMGFYRKMVGKIVENSVLSFTSSRGFRKYLPDSPKLLDSHNISNIEFHEEMKQYLPREKHTPIRISFWGLIRNVEINEQIIKRLGGDDRFELHYYGRAQGRILSLMEEGTAKYSNIRFHGEYKPSDRIEMARNTDIIHNMYNKTEKTSHIAMGNKYYDGLLFSLPQLCTEESLMGQLCTQNGIGLECDPYADDFNDKIFDYYTSLDEESLAENCSKELRRVLCEVEYGNEKMNEAFENARN
ncbi:MAG: glycosyltransferase family 4 protein [Ruminococcaceae bacterium]|nr:glycosyltransferase family 4 protein [Oscillospiraceae bacterium]